MITYECENGQRVSFGTAERSEVKEGFIHFYDVNGNEVGRQPVAAAPEPEPAPAPVEPPKEPPQEPPAAPPVDKEPDHHDAT